MIYDRIRLPSVGVLPSLGVVNTSSVLSTNGYRIHTK